MLSSKVPGSSFLENNDLKSDFICNSNPFKDHLFDLVPIEFAFSSFAYLLGPKIDWQWVNNWYKTLLGRCREDDSFDDGFLPDSRL